MSKGRGIFYLLILALIIVAIIYIIPEVEWHAPQVDIKIESQYIGLKPFDVEIKDKGKGLKEVSILLVNERGQIELINKIYQLPTNEDKITIALDPKAHGLKDGPAEIKVVAEDGSRLKLFSGNKTEVNRKVILDLEAPKVEVLTADQYINHGGSGLAIYKASEDSVKSGVKVGDYFFPGYKGYFTDPNAFLAFFAFPFNMPSDQKLTVISEDAAGNSKEVVFSHNLKGVVYKKSDITIEDDFIKGKMASLLGSDSSEENDSKKIFIQVNRELRKKNDNTIKEIGSKSSDSIKWKGAFHQLSNSQVEANFADERTYYINGEPIDQQYHLGYDLAVTKRYPIEAANDGAVVFTGDLGIYGNSIIIDHGMGVMTLYGHVSSIDVKEGDSIKKSQIIGRTGETGLAVGDHLHYGVYINGVPVRPIEWWDEKWINDNIILKIKTAEAEFGSKQIKTEASPEKSSQETDKKVEN